jgi:hypothetical protein
MSKGPDQIERALSELLSAEPERWFPTKSLWESMFGSPGGLHDAEREQLRITVTRALQGLHQKGLVERRSGLLVCGNIPEFEKELDLYRPRWTAWWRWKETSSPS